MNSNLVRIKKSVRRIEAMVLAVIIITTSMSFTASATENNNTEQEQTIEQEEESEQGIQASINNIRIDELGDSEIPELMNETEIDEIFQQKIETEEVFQKEIEPEDQFTLIQEESSFEEENVPAVPRVEYSVQTDVSGYKIKLEAYEGVFPEGEELSLNASIIDNQAILDLIDSKISDVCEGEFKQTSFDIKVLNAAGEELQPDRSQYIENKDIVPIQLSIEFANDEIEGEVEVFHFADDLSSMECLVSTVDGDEVTVEPEHFSVFTIIESNDGSYFDGLPVPTGYRTYIEWMPNSTAGLRRLQKIYVYANEGEQISFGSSSFANLSKNNVTQSLKDSFGYGVGTAPTNASIAVTLPYDSDAMQEKVGGGVNYQIYSGSTNPAAVCSQISSVTAYGNTNIYLFNKQESASVSGSAPGTIYNWQQEALGAKNAANPGGYEPISFTAPLTGVYTFRFFGNTYTKTAAKKARKTDAFLLDAGSYVGAWDITVTKPEAPTAPVIGRTYTDALVWTIGANISADEPILNESVYALTRDGFEYKVDFNGLDPFGFIFYTNKRGLLVSSDDHDDGQHYRSLARSVKSTTNTLEDLLDKGVHINSTPTSDKDESYFVTFEKAHEDLLQHYTGRSSLTDNSHIGTNNSSYKNFQFKGLNSDTAGVGTEGYGGYFTFDYDIHSEPSDVILPSTYEIVIDFTNNETLKKAYGYPPDKHNEVILSNALVDGKNSIFWDGKDEYGNVVVGGSGEEGISYNIVSFHVKAGEVHFPLLDVENNRYGIKVQMQNNINAEGLDKSRIYYDNSNSDLYGINIGDKKETLAGVSSGDGAMRFDSGAGDYCVIDIWSDYRVATPLTGNYTFKLRAFSNDNAFFRAKTEWEYYYITEDGRKHYDSSDPLP